MSGRRTARHLLACVTLLAGAAGCGDEPMPDPQDGVAEETTTPPLDADVFVASLTRDAQGTYSIGPLENLSRRPGYDNQPSFVPDGSGLWYTVVDDHDGQADIWRYDFDPPRVTRVTSSNPESEYSATALPGGGGISVVRVEADSTQRLWRFSASGSLSEVLLADVAPVGYHAWIDETTVALFVLGTPATLQRADLRTGRSEVLARDIGRSVQSIPGSYDVSYVQRADDGSTLIMRLPGDGSPAEPIVAGLANGDFHAWAPNRTLFMADGGGVFQWSENVADGWIEIADFAPLGIAISRLAVSPDGSQIALVGEPSMAGMMPEG